MVMQKRNMENFWSRSGATYTMKSGTFLNLLTVIFVLYVRLRHESMLSISD